MLHKDQNWIILNVTFLIRKRFRSLLVRSELFRMRYQELFEKTADVTDEGEALYIFPFFEQ